MPMTPRERKAALVLNGVTQTAIAAAARKSPGYVSEIIRGTRRNELVEQLIAQEIGKPVEEVFAPRAAVEAA